jgi:hypothetical protein
MSNENDKRTSRASQTREKLLNQKSGLHHHL